MTLNEELFWFLLIVIAGTVLLFWVTLRLFEARRRERPPTFANSYKVRICGTVFVRADIAEDARELAVGMLQVMGIEPDHENIKVLDDLA